MSSPLIIIIYTITFLCFVFFGLNYLVSQSCMKYKFLRWWVIQQDVYRRRRPKCVWLWTTLWLVDGSQPCWPQSCPWRSLLHPLLTLWILPSIVFISLYRHAIFYCGDIWILGWNNKAQSPPACLSSLRVPIPSHMSHFIITWKISAQLRGHRTLAKILSHTLSVVLIGA